jgi:beta-glucosidase
MFSLTLSHILQLWHNRTMRRRDFLRSAVGGALLARVAGAQTGAKPFLKFPKGFRWGTATAAYQIEGAVAADGRGASIWDTFCRQPGKIHNGETGDAACDHYHRWAADVELMKRLNANSYRFSVAWPRVVPDGRGALNQKGLDFYERLTDALLKRGVEPFLTLYHWDLPQKLQDEGGWTNRATADAFAVYAEAVARRLGDRVRHWITQNEPLATTFLGHVLGLHAPGARDLAAALKVSHHLLLSHGRGVQAIRAHVKRAQVGIVNVNLHVEAATDKPEDVAAAKRYDSMVTRWFHDPVFTGEYPSDALENYEKLFRRKDLLPIEAGDMQTIAAPTDFLGVNYYTRNRVGAGLEPPAGTRREPPVGTPTAMGWEVYPQGLYEVLKRLHRDYAPPVMYVTENGAAYQDTLTRDSRVLDPQRQTYLREHFMQAHRALTEGVPLKGYFVWSLLDNFEWAEGYDKRFGLVYVDFPTQRRIVKQSGAWFAQVAKSNGLKALP